MVTLPKHRACATRTQTRALLRLKTTSLLPILLASQVIYNTKSQEKFFFKYNIVVRHKFILQKYYFCQRTLFCELRKWVLRGKLIAIAEAIIMQKIK